MNHIGFDKNNNKLQIGDICNFRIDKEQYEGMIMYDEESFAFTFEMKDDNFPSVYMMKADLGSTERICNVANTIRGDKFEVYREIYNLFNGGS